MNFHKYINIVMKMYVYKVYKDIPLFNIVFAAYDRNK